MDLDVHLPGIAAGDADELGRWIAGAERRLRESLRPLAERVDVEAVLQETLLRIWQLAPRVRPDGRPDSLLRFAIRVGRNLALDELRRARCTPTELAGLEAAVERAGERAAAAPWHGPDPHLRRAIARCREELRGPPAMAIEARLLSQGAEPDAALAARLHMRLNTFLQNVGRARRALADCLERRGVDLGLELP